MQRNARDEKALKRASEKEKLLTKRRIDDVNLVMSTQQGRRFVWDLLEFTGVFSVGWDPSARIHFNAGMRNVGLKVFSELHQVCPDQYLLMAKEAADESKERQKLDEALTEAENGDANG